MFTNLPFSRLVHSEFHQYLKSFLSVVDAADPKTLKIKDERDVLAEMLPSLLAALNNEAASEETKDIEALDLKRDNAITGLSKIIDGYTLHEDAAKKAAANLLQLFIDAQGPRISKLNYSAETTVLTKITTNFKNEAKYTAAVALLGLEDWVENMETANNNFETKYKARNTSLTINKNIPAFGVLKAQAIPLYTELTDLIQSRYKTAKADKQPTDAYLNLINEINTLIDSYLVYTQPAKPKAKPGDPTLPA
jgi:Family of unknown function (DUF6261)